MLATEEKAQETHKQIKDMPEGWKVCRLGDVAHLQRGKFSARPRNDPKYFGGHIPFIQTGDVTNSNGRIQSYSQTLNSDGLRVSKLFPSKTLFFTIAANIGDVGIASFAAACPDSLVAISPKSKIDKMWMFQALKYRKKEFENLATQNAQLNINLEKLNPYLIAIPPVNEQLAIAAALGDIDSLINSLDELIAKKRNIKLAAMQQLLTGRQRLSGFSEEWKLKRFGDVLKVRHGRSQKEVEVINGKYPILASGGEIGRTNHYLHDKPSVLIGRKGTIDSPQYIEIPFWTVDTLFFTEISNYGFPKFIFYKFNMVHWRIYSEASGVPSLNASTIEGIEFNTPNCLEEQIAIARVLSDMDSEILVIEQQLDKARNLKQGMMQELLTGRIRLT